MLEGQNWRQQLNLDYFGLVSAGLHVPFRGETVALDRGHAEEGLHLSIHDEHQLDAEDVLVQEELFHHDRVDLFPEPCHGRSDREAAPLFLRLDVDVDAAVPPAFVAVEILEPVHKDLL